MFQQTPPLAGPSRFHDLADAVLGLDLGMTATRASLMRLNWKGDSDHEPIGISRPDAYNHQGEYHAGDFPATAYPFQLNDKLEDCLGYAADAHADPFPLKMYCYFNRSRLQLAEGKLSAFNKIRKSIPQIDDLWKRLNPHGSAEYQERVAKHLKDIFRYHMTVVRDHSRQKAVGKGMRIVKLAVTLPPNWDHLLQKMYVELLSEVWTDIADDNIITIYESEAVGHWMLRCDRRWQDASQEKLSDKLLIADFGGHTMNFQLFGILRRGTEGRFAFFSLVDAWSAHGGSEFHSTLVKAKLASKIEQKRLNLRDEEREHLFWECMKEYRALRASVDGQAFCLEGRKKRVPGEQRILFKFTKSEAESMYKKAFADQPLKSLIDELRAQGTKKTNELSNNIAGETEILQGTQAVVQADVSKRTEKTTVVLTGGSFLNCQAMSQVKAVIDERGLEHLPWIEAMGNPANRSSMISAGAALAVTNTASISEYMSQAVFALDICETEAPDGSDRIKLPILLSSRGSRPVTVDLSNHQGAKVFLACSPLAPLHRVKSVLREETYELYLVDWLKKGKYQFSLEHKVVAGEGQHRDWLTLTMIPLTKKKNGSVESPIVQNLPFYYDPGGCVCHIDMDLFKKLDTGKKNKNFTNRKGAKFRAAWDNTQGDGAAGFWDDTLEINPHSGHRTRAKSRMVALREEKEKQELMKFATELVSEESEASVGSAGERRTPEVQFPPSILAPITGNRLSREDSQDTVTADNAAIGVDIMRSLSAHDIYDNPDIYPQVSRARANPLKRPAERPLDRPRRPNRQRAPVANMSSWADVDLED